MKRFWPAVVMAGLSLTGPACASTGPTDTLTGFWQQSGGDAQFTLRQTGGNVTGTAGPPSCNAPAVSGSVDGADVTLTIGTGASASTFTGRFVDPSHVQLILIVPANIDEAFTIAKMPPPVAIAC